MAALDRELAVVASAQRMLITVHDVRRAGGASHHIQRRIEGGRWTGVEHGVYLISGASLDWATRQLAAVLAAGPGTMASHLATARLLGLQGFSQAGVELSIPRGCRYRRAGVRTHESTDLDRCMVIRCSGVPLTDPARTILDLGRYLGVPRLRRVVEDARRQGLVTWSSLVMTLARHARRGRHGTRRLRAVIAHDAHRDEVTDSDFELLVLSLLVDAGLPEPVVHHRVESHGRFVAEVDLAYPDWRVAIECGGRSHLQEDVRPDSIVRDVRKAIDAARGQSILAAVVSQTAESCRRFRTTPGLAAVVSQDR